MLMTCAGLFIHRSPPPDPVKKYIKEVTPGFVKDIPTRPQTQLTYKIPSTAPVKGTSQIVIDITDETEKKLKIDSFHITIPAGTDASDLFSRPETDPPENLIKCTVSDETRFKVRVSLSSTAENHMLLFQVYAVEKGQPFDQLKITCTGTANEVPGKANISITEILHQDDDEESDEAQTDRVKHAEVEKEKDD
ncbi:hypothetical protein VTN00DRAFT_7418 [Thermoascus crustaceus]|uniref:uncharacterized protein n=1 Tax=Thermoascus crustaceus TaxID=5088 RepID=UPI00374222D8